MAGVESGQEPGLVTLRAAGSRNQSMAVSPGELLGVASFANLRVPPNQLVVVGGGVEQLELQTLGELLLCLLMITV